MINIITSYIEEKAFFKASKDIKRTLKENNKINKILFLVPEQFTVEAERMLTDKLTAKGLIDIEVLSIKRLSNRILTKTKSEVPKTLDESGKSMVLSFILNELKEELICFNRLTNNASFNENVCELFSELKKNNVTDEDLSPDKFSDEENNNNFLYKKTHDIHKIYERYNNFLGTDFWDADDLTFHASQNLDKARFLDNSEIYYFGFESFDKNIYSLIETISKREINQTFLFTAKDDIKSSPAYKIVENTIYKLHKLADKCNEEFNIQTQNEEEKEKDLKFLADNIFSYDTKEYKDKVTNIEIFKASCLYEEVENTAINILKLIKEENALYRDIQVLPSDYETYKNVISEVFNKYKINYFLDNTSNVIDTNILRGIIKILNIISSNFQTNDIISFLKTGLTDLSKDDIETFENYALEFGIKGTMWLKDFKRNNKFNDYNLDYLNEKKDAFILPLITLKENFKNTKNVKETTTVFYKFLKDFGLDEKIKRIVKNFEEKDDYTNANKYAQIYNSIINIFEQLYNFLGEEKLSLKEYAKIMESGFKALKIGIIPSTIDSVNIATLSRSRSSDIKYLFILGVNDGILPTNFAQSGGIFSNKEKLQIIESGVEIRSTNEYKQQEEKYFLTSLILKTQKHIYFSYPILSPSGDELTESSIIMRIKNIMPNIRTKTFNKDNLDDNLSLISNFDATFKHLINNKINKSENNEVNNLWEEVYDIYKNDNLGKNYINIMESAINFSNNSEISNKKLINEIYNGKMITSISQLETYAKCPFSYFISYIISPIERKKLELNSPDIGNILHEIIYIFSNKIINNEVDVYKITSKELNDLTKEITKEVTEKYSKGKVKQIVNSAYFKKKLLRNSSYALSNIVTQLRRSNFHISKCESEFGEDKENSLNFITKENNIVSIKGKIDRIDTYNSDDGEYVKVIDYKTKGETFDFSKSYYGINMQLPIYLAATTLNNNSEPAGALYFRISPEMTNVKNSEDLKTLIDKAEENQIDGVVIDNTDILNNIDDDENNGIVKKLKSKRNKVIPKEDLSNLINHATNLAKEISDNIINGKISITPYKKANETPCEYCKYENICHFDTCFKDNKFNELPKAKAEDILKLIKEESENEMD